MSYMSEINSVIIYLSNIQVYMWYMHMYLHQVYNLIHVENITRFKMWKMNLVERKE